MRGTNQGGSLAGFIIVGVLLALVVVGGLYGLNRYNAQRASDEASQQEEQPAQNEEESTDDAANEEAPAAPTNDDTSPAPAAGADAKSDTPTAAAAPSLPETGPADTALTLLALASLSFAVVHYVRSRHAAAR